MNKSNKLLLTQSIMLHRLLPLCALLTPSLALTQRHQLTTTPTHQFFAGEVFQTFQLLGVIVVIVVIGACCFYFRGCFSGHERQQTAVVVQAPQARQENRVAAPPPRYEYDEPVAPPEPRNNAILDYFGSQKAPIVRPPQTIKESTSPYVMKKQAESSGPWEATSAAITSCGVCGLFNKGNEIPMVQVECLEDHCFHVGCLSKHRSRVTLELGGNGLNKCPKCRESYSPIVRVICPSCKRTAISVNLVDFSDTTGQIATQRIVSKYGSCCHNCT